MEDQKAADVTDAMLVRFLVRTFDADGAEVAFSKEQQGQQRQEGQQGQLIRQRQKGIEQIIQHTLQEMAFLPKQCASHYNISRY